MKEIIRSITKEDFEEVSALHDFDNDVDELKWLYRDTDDKNTYNGFVAVNTNNEIIGSICYRRFNYCLNGTRTSCVVPANWILKSNYKGMAGVLLFKKVAELGDVSITVEGTEVAQKLYALFKYRKIASSNYYYKVLNLMKFYRGIKRKNFFKKLSMFGYLLPTYFKTSFRKSIIPEIHLIPYDSNNFYKSNEDQNVLKKEITKNYFEWLLDCPNVKTLGYVIKEKERALGMCVMYIKRRNNILNGRIIQLPYLGVTKELWVSALTKCVDVLRNKKCGVVSIVSLHEDMNKGIEESGFKSLWRHSQPIYLKDRKGLFKELNTEKWQFQFSEADVSFRNF